MSEAESYDSLALDGTPESISDVSESVPDAWQTMPCDSLALDGTSESISDISESVPDCWQNTPCEVRRFLSQLLAFRDFTPEMHAELAVLCERYLLRDVSPTEHVTTLDAAENLHSEERNWSLLQLVHLLLQKALMAPHFESSLGSDGADLFYNDHLVARLVRLCQSPDPRERHFIKQSLCLLFQRFEGLRLPIWKRVSDDLIYKEFFFFHHNGVADMLSLLSYLLLHREQSFGDAQEQLLFRVVLPLYKRPNIVDFHEDLCDLLSSCLVRAPSQAAPIIHRLLKLWPSTSLKQRQCLGCLLLLLEYMPVGQLTTVMHGVLKRLGLCLSSPIKAVNDTALQILATPVGSEMVCQYEELFLELVFPNLYVASTQHWCLKVRCLAGKLYADTDAAAKLKLLQQHASQLWTQPKVSPRVELFVRTLRQLREAKEPESEPEPEPAGQDRMSRLFECPTKAQ